MTSEVADGITRVAGSRTNAYIIRDGDSLCLIDTGYPGEMKLIVEAIDRLGRSIGDVSAVLLTHAHVDHIGSAERIRTEHGAVVHVHPEEAAHARGEREERMSTGYMLSRIWWPKMFSFVLNAVRAGAAKVQHVREVSTFTSEPRALDLPGSPVPVFTPGHTTGHCAFHLEERGVVFTGDALVTHDSLTLKTGPRVMHKAFNHDQHTAVDSLHRLRGLSAGTLLPGHGDPFRGSPADAVAEALSRVR